MTDRALQAYYAREEERDRLSFGVGRVEYSRTVEIVGRTLPPPGAVVADIGGGPGRYTDWLIGAGYQVIHRDVVADHVDQVIRRHGERVDAALGDARALDLADDSVDVVLLLGPLYHLEHQQDRLKSLAEARRVVRSGGVVHAAAITRWAARLHGMLVDHVHLQYPAMTQRADEQERTGVMRPLHDRGFSGYAHTPDELRDEVAHARTWLWKLSSASRGSRSPCPTSTTAWTIPASGHCSSTSFGRLRPSRNFLASDHTFSQPPASDSPHRRSSVACATQRAPNCCGFLRRTLALPAGQLLGERHRRAAAWAVQGHVPRGSSIPRGPNQRRRADRARCRELAQARLVEPALRAHALHRTMAVVPLNRPRHRRVHL